MENTNYSLLKGYTINTECLQQNVEHKYKASGVWISENISDGLACVEVFMRSFVSMYLNKILVTEH